MWLGDLLIHILKQGHCYIMKKIKNDMIISTVTLSIPEYRTNYLYLYLFVKRTKFNSSFLSNTGRFYFLDE